MIFVPLSAANADTLPGEVSPAVTTAAAAVASTASTVATTATATVTLTAAQKAAAAKAKAKAKKLAAAKKKAAIKAKKKAKAQADRKRIMKLAKKYRGIRYTYGGATPGSGFDCSGFTKYIFKKAINKNLPHSANAQSSRGRKISAKKAKPGDLVIFSEPGNHNFHVAIYYSKTKIIGATVPGDVTRIGSSLYGTRTYVDIVDPSVGL